MDTTTDRPHGGNTKNMLSEKAPASFAALHGDGFRPLFYIATQTGAVGPIGVMYCRHEKRPGAIYTSLIYERAGEWIYQKPDFAYRLKNG
jgi:hypothetical protein